MYSEPTQLAAAFLESDITLLLSISLKATSLPPPPSSLLPPLFYRVTTWPTLYTQTDAGMIVSQETKYKNINLLLMMHGSALWYWWIHELITQGSGCSLKELVENSVATMKSVQWYTPCSFFWHEHRMSKISFWNFC